LASNRPPIRRRFPRQANRERRSRRPRKAWRSSVRAWRYSAHELGAVDLIARERLRSSYDDVAWGDLWPSFDRLRFGLRSVVNPAKHAPVIAPGGASLALDLFQHCGHLQGQNHWCVIPVKLGEPRRPSATKSHSEPLDLQLSDRLNRRHVEVAVIAVTPRAAKKAARKPPASRRAAASDYFSANAAGFELDFA
jgi:hypothetical protein